MMPTLIEEQAAVPPPSFQRGQARLSRALHIDALTLVTTLHLLTLCRLAVRLAHRCCPTPLPAGKGEGHAPIVKRVCCSSVSCEPCGAYHNQDMHDWLKSWPALAQACGFPLNKEGRLVF